MTTAYQEIQAKALALSHAERDALAQELVDSLDEIDPSEQAEIDKAWAEEAEKRIDEMLSGKEPGIPVEKVLADIRREMGWSK